MQCRFGLISNLICSGSCARPGRKGNGCAVFDRQRPASPPGHADMQDLKRLTAFIAVANTGSFTAAALQMGLSTPAVSKMISRLEHSLDSRLFRRTTRSIALTDAGRIYLSKVSAALAELEHAEDLLKEARQEPAGVIRALTSAAVGKDYLMPILGPFLERYPKIDLELRFDDGQHDLIKEGFDFALQLSPSREASQICRHLLDLELVLVASTAYLARNGVPATPNDLAAHQCINIFQHSGHAGIWEFTGDKQKKPNIVHPKGRLLVAGQYDAVINAAIMGMGITVVFARSALPYLKSGQLKIILPGYRIRGGVLENQSLHLRYPHRSYMPFSVRIMLDYLIEHFRAENQAGLDLRHFIA